MRKTKIIATIGPASENKTTLRKLMLAGMDVARLNFSHGTYLDHKNKIDLVQLLNKELNKEVAVMLDTKGPEVRTHMFKDGGVYIEKNSEVKIFMEEVLGTEEYFSVTYPNLINDLSIGTTILVDDGYLQLLVIDIDKTNGYLLTVAKNGHFIKDRRGINVPNTTLNLPFVSNKDLEDIIFGIHGGIDYIAASFTRKKEDILEIKKILDEHHDDHIQIIAKIENQEGVDNLDDILSVADGIMVARGDLGVEIFPEDIPKIQKEMIIKCQQQNKIVIVATQMLESMQKNPRPTRAEVSDVANAIYEGADAVMLSGETASGMYPIESIELMSRIALRTEKDVNYTRLMENIGPDSDNNVLDIVAYGAAKVTQRYLIKAIVTKSIAQANQISRYRINAPVYVIVKSLKEAYKFALFYGVIPVVKAEDEKLEYLEINVFNQDIILNLDDDGFEVVTI